MYESRTSSYWNQSIELDTLVNQDDHAAQMRCPVRGRTGFLKIEGFAGKRSLLPPPPPRSFHLFAVAPFFARPEYEKLIRTAGILVTSYGNVCYGGYAVTETDAYSRTL